MLKQPNHTQIPNEFLDVEMRKLNGAAVRVFLVVCRKTIGWHKETDAISVSQIMELAGLSEGAVKGAIAELEVANLVMVDRVSGGRGHGNFYTVMFDKGSEERGVISNPLSVEKGDKNHPPLSDEGGQKLPPTKERVKETRKETLQPPSVPALPRSKDRRLITDYYQDRFLEDHENTEAAGVKPEWNGRIMKLVDADLKRLGVDLLGELVQDFWDHPTDFVSRNGTGKGYNVFHCQIDTLLERKARVRKSV